MKLDLKSIAMRARNAEFNPKVRTRFTAACLLPLSLSDEYQLIHISTPLTNPATPDYAFNQLITLITTHSHPLPPFLLYSAVARFMSEPVLCRRVVWCDDDVMWI